MPSAHWLVGTAELIPWSTAGRSPPVLAASGSSSPHAPTTERNPRANSASLVRGVANSEALLTSQVLCGLRGLRTLAWGHGGTSQAVLSPFSFLLFWNKTAETVKVAQHELCRRPLSPPPSAPRAEYPSPRAPGSLRTEQPSGP